MFKTKERSIDKANIEIGCLKEQRTDLLTMYRGTLDKNDALLAKMKRLEKELCSNNNDSNINTEYYNLIEDRDRILSVLEKSQSYRVSNANEISRLRDKLNRLQTNHEKVVEECEDLLWERDTLLLDKKAWEKKNKGLKLDIEGMKGDYRDIVTECGDLLHEREGFLTGTMPVYEDKKGLILLKLSSDAMELLDKMAHRLPEAFTTRDKRYAACIEKLVLVLRNRNGDKK
jgi:chromosome segregation ATPase